MDHRGWAVSKSAGGKAKVRNPPAPSDPVMEAGAPHQPLPSCTPRRCL